MRNQLTRWMLGAVACCAVAAVAADVPDSSMRAGALAASVPVDARLFLEVRDAAGLSQTPAARRWARCWRG